MASRMNNDDKYIQLWRILLKNGKDVYVTLYPWYYVPASAHKGLIYGTDVIRFEPLPIIGNIIPNTIYQKECDT